MNGNSGNGICGSTGIVRPRVVNGDGSAGRVEEDHNGKVRGLQGEMGYD